MKLRIKTIDSLRWGKHIHSTFLFYRDNSHPRRWRYIMMRVNLILSKNYNFRTGQTRVEWGALASSLFCLIFYYYYSSLCGFFYPYLNGFSLLRSESATKKCGGRNKVPHIIHTEKISPRKGRQWKYKKYTHMTPTRNFSPQKTNANSVFGKKKCFLRRQKLNEKNDKRYEFSFPFDERHHGGSINSVLVFHHKCVYKKEN